MNTRGISQHSRILISDAERDLNEGRPVSARHLRDLIFGLEVDASNWRAVNRPEVAAEVEAICDTWRALIPMPVHA